MLARFSFRLQFLLDLKKRMEDQEKQTLAKLQREKMRILEEKRKTQLELEKTLGEFYSAPLTKDRMSWFVSYIRGLKEEISRLEEEIRKKEKEIEEQREKLVKISKERRLLERLREKRYQEWLEEFNRELQKVLDEQAIIRFNSAEREP